MLIINSPTGNASGDQISMQNNGHQVTQHGIGTNNLEGKGKEVRTYNESYHVQQVSTKRNRLKKASSMDASTKYSP